MIGPEEPNEQPPEWYRGELPWTAILAVMRHPSAWNLTKERLWKEWNEHYFVENNRTIVSMNGYRRRELP